MRPDHGSYARFLTIALKIKKRMAAILEYMVSQLCTPTNKGDHFKCKGTASIWNLSTGVVWDALIIIYNNGTSNKSQWDSST